MSRANVDRTLGFVRLEFAGINAKTNCAGRECKDRAGCRRYEVRIPARIEIVRGHRVPMLEWGSFDIERMVEGNCVHRISLQDRALKKAA